MGGGEVDFFDGKVRMRCELGRVSAYAREDYYTEVRVEESFEDGHAEVSCGTGKCDLNRRHLDLIINRVEVRFEK